MLLWVLAPQTQVYPVREGAVVQWAAEIAESYAESGESAAR